MNKKIDFSNKNKLSSSDDISKQCNFYKENLKVAWQYKKYFKNKDASKGSQTANFYFDSTTINSQSVTNNHKEKFYLIHFDIKTDLSDFLITNLDKLYGNTLRNKNEHSCKLLINFFAEDQNLSWYDIFNIKSFAYSTKSVAYIPIKTSKLNDSIKHLSDYILHVKSFRGDFNCSEPKSRYGDFDGIINLLKSREPIKGDCCFLYKLRYKKFVIEKFSLPPEMIREDGSELKVDDKF